MTVAILHSPPPKEDSYSLTTLRAESTQTLQIMVLRPMSKAAVQNECGMLMCAVAGPEPQDCRMSISKTPKATFDHGDTQH